MAGSADKQQPATDDDKQQLSPDDKELLAAWNSRLVNSPEIWRARAAGNAGLVSAAAAATAAGLLLRTEPISGWALRAASIAAGAYALSVVLLIVATVWPAPKTAVTANTLAEAVYNMTSAEVGPIRRFVIGGTCVSAIALLATAAALVLAAQESPIDEQRVQVSFRERSVQSAVQSMCPKLTGKSFDATMLGSSSSEVRLQFTTKQCGNPAAILVLQPEDVILRTTGQ